MNIARTLSRGIVAPLLGSVAAILPVCGADIQKANNATALNLAGSWAGGVVPGAGDIALFNSAISAPLSVSLGGDLAWQGIRLTNVGGARNAANTAVTITNAGSANTLSLGSGGIDMSTALQTLVIQSRIAITADQTWNVTDANTAVNPAGLNQNEDLTFFGQAAGVPVNLGGFTVTKGGNGTAAFSSGHTISNGTFNVEAGVLHFQGGSSRTTTIESTVSFNVNNGGTLRFASQSGAGGLTTQVNAAITLNTGSTLALHLNQTPLMNLTGNITAAGNTTWTVFGGSTGGTPNFSGNLLGSGAITYANTTTNAGGFVRMTGNNSGYSGTLTLNGASGTRTLRLAGADAGSANATWSIGAANILEVDGVGVQLGTLTGTGTVTNSHTTNTASISVGAGDFAGTIADGIVFGGMSLTKVGPGTLTLTGTNTYTGNTLVNQGTLIAGSGSLGQTNVIVADGASFTPRVTAPGSTLFLPGLTIGTSTGGTLNFDLGTFGNPTVAALSAATFTPQTPTVLKVTGSGLAPGTFPLLDYSGAIGGVGIGGLSLLLPPRVIGSLNHDVGNTLINVTITGLDTPKWTGATNGNWDIDDGTGTGTTNWREINNGGVTRYLQTTGGSDTVTFDDSATGTTTVNLTTTLLPNGITVNNSALPYTFTGTGRLSGTAGLTKFGSGTLRLINSGTNDYSGPTTISEGTLEVGDSVTAGAGTLGTGAITNNGTLILSRPDTITFSQTLSGAGGITKNGAETATFAGNVAQAGPIVLNGGTLTFSGGGTLSGPISGSGALTSTAGTFEINGADANTYTGMTTVSNGNLRLNKTSGVNAVGGNVTITEGGTLSLVGAEQIPDTASITFTGTSGDSIPGAQGGETVASVLVNPSVATGQLIMRNNFTVTGTGTVQNGILGVASGNTAKVNAVVMTGGILRIAGSAGPSTLEVGPGGITASGGVIEVKFNTNDQDAVLNLNGDFTATANIPINNAGYTGANLNQIVLFGQRTFNLAAGTTTTVQPDVTGTGGITKAGAGTLDLLGRAVTYVGDTVINGGTLRTSTVNQSGTASVTIGDGGTLELRVPSAGTSLTTSTATFGSVTGGTMKVDISSTGNPTAAPLITTSLATQGTNILALIGATTAGTFTLIDYSGAIGGSGFVGFQLQLPLRVAGSLVNNLGNTSIDVTIQGTDTPKWNGNVNANWDIDDGTGTGTANWRGAFTGTATRYLQGSLGTDMVIFDDTATGSKTVNLSTTLTPAGITVDTEGVYVFSGTGKIGGSGGLVKIGAGELSILNTGGNDFTGAISIAGGTVRVGNNLPGGAGSLGSGAITNDGALILNRADDSTLSNAISGVGSIIHAGSGKTTLAGALTYSGNTTVNVGTLALNSPSMLASGVVVAQGATLSLDHATGTVTGSISNNGTVILNNTPSLTATIDGSGGILVNTPGNKNIGGLSANTFTGPSTVTAGNLILNKNSGGVGVPAIGGDLLIDGGVVTVGVAGSHLGNQFADISSITVNSGQLLSTFAEGSNKDDTIANLTIHAATPVSTFNGFNITGTLTITAGAQHDAVNSNGTTTANTAILSNTNIRLGANGGPSTLNIGTGGVSLSNASIVYGSAGDPSRLATVNLSGNVTASGTSAFDVNTGNPMSRIDLGFATRTFNITDGTTTVESSIISSNPTAGLVKTGAGTLILAVGTNTNGESNYGGDTVVSEGTFTVNGSLSGTNVIVNGGTLAGGGTINPGLAGVILEAGGKLSPGIGASIPGTLSVNESVDVSGATTATGSAALVFDLDTPFSSDRVLVNGGILTIGNAVLGFDDFAFTASVGFTDQTTYVLFDGTSPIVGTLGANRFGTINGLAAELQFADNGNDLVLFVPEPGSATLLLGGFALLTTRRRRTT